VVDAEILPPLPEPTDTSDPTIQDTAADLIQAPSDPATSVAAPLIAPALDEADLPQAEEYDDEDDGSALPQRRAGGRQPGARRGGAAGQRRPGAVQRDASQYVPAPTVSPAHLRARHYGVMALFVLMVIVPTIAYSWYLYNRAADQYESDVGFGSRTEDAPSTFDFLGALGGVGGSSSKDMDILNQFIVSQDLVSRVNARLDLRAIWSKPQNDPLFALDPRGTIEDLVAYWQRMVLISYDNSTGLMSLRVFAFDPQDARNIAQEVLNESTRTINDLSQTAQEDTTRYSKEALQTAEDRLQKARIALTDFRVRNRIVDPSADLASQNSILGTLNQQLATALVELDLLTGSAAPNDPRLTQINRRIEVIRNRIAEEQAKVGATTEDNSAGYANLVSDYQRLQVDSDFAEKAYLSALAGYDQAVADAQHKTRYLATYLAPTLAEAPTAPNRPLLTALTALIGFLAWAILVLIYYALRDRR